MEVSNVRAMEKGGRCRRFDEEKNVLFLLGIKHNSSVDQPVA
jgi:hypothetical protein